MGENTLAPVADALALETGHIDQFFTALVMDVVPRNPDGVPEALAGQLGTEDLAWSETHTERLFVAGREFVLPEDDASAVNAIISGATSSLSRQPKFIKANGSTNAATILGLAVPLILTVNGGSVTYSADSSVLALTVAPSTNNTALVNQPALSGQPDTRYLQQIPIDAVGSAITALNGRIAAFKIGTEIFLALVDTTAGVLEVQQRGYFFDSANAPISRVTISDNAVITLLSACWIFADETGTQGSFTAGQLSYSATAPAAPVTNDYWYDTSANQWKRYSGAAWQGAAENVHRLLIGVAVCDASNCIAARAFDFTIEFSDRNTLALKKTGAATLQSVRASNHISVYGSDVALGRPSIWDMAANLAPGVSEAASTRYFCYVKDNGDRVISDVAPNYFAGRRGGYHPFETWRFVGSALNDGSSNLGAALNYLPEDTVALTSTGAILNPHGLPYGLLLVGGGGSPGIGSGFGGDTTAAFTDGVAGGGNGGSSGTGGTATGGKIAKAGNSGTANPTNGGTPSNRITTFEQFYSFENQTSGVSVAATGPGNGGNSNTALNNGGGGGGGVYDVIRNGLNGFAYIGAAGSGGDTAGGTGTAIAKFI